MFSYYVFLFVFIQDTEVEKRLLLAKEYVVPIFAYSEGEEQKAALKPLKKWIFFKQLLAKL